MNRLLANRGLLQIFCSLLLVIMIMSASSYVVYKKSISGIYDKVTQNNRLVVKNIIQAFDSSFTTVNNLIFTIHGLPFDPVKSGDGGRMDMAQVYNLQDNLASLISSVDYIEDVIVFYDNQDLAITANGTSDMKLLFQNKYRHDTYNASYWRSFSKSKRPFTVFPSSDYMMQTEGSKPQSRQLIAVMDGNKYKLSDKNVIILINAEKLLQHVNMSSMIPGSSMIVLDGDRKIVLSTEKNWDLVEVLNDVYFNQSQEDSLTRGDFEYHVYQSDYNDFIYIDKMPYQFQNIDTVASGSRIIMVIAIVSAVLLSGLLSVYLYLPVKGILQLFGEGRVKGNDFRKIYSGIVKVQRENEALRQRMERAEADMCRNAFFRVLESQRSSDIARDVLKYEPFFFRDRSFVMASLELRLSQKGDRSHPAMEPRQIAELLRKELGSMAGAGYTAVFHQREMQFLILLGIPQGGDRQTVISGWAAFIQEANRDVLPGYVLRSFVSKDYEAHVPNLLSAYQDVLNGMLYRNVQDEAQTVIDTAAVQYVGDVYFPLEKMDHLARCLTAGLTEESIQIVTDIIHENARRNIHHYHLAHVAKSMFLYLIKPAKATAEGDQELMQLESRFIRRVEQAYDHREITEALLEVVKQVAGSRGGEPKSKLNPAFISQYIELHYMNNLYLDHMAEVLDTSPKYFSNYFKKTFGINYVEYLNKVRLAHAREFLKNTDYNISEIGEKTGYMNASTFTTTFKKYYGISPSEYRKMAGEG